MPRRSSLFTRRRIGPATALAVTAALLIANSASATSSAHHKKALSLPSIEVVSGSNPGSIPTGIATARHYFSQQGLTVNDFYTPLSGSSIVALLISGAAQFIMINSSSEILAAQQGAPLRAVAMTDSPSQQEIAVSTSFATAHNIPLAGNSAASALAQFKALRGTNISVGVANTSSDSYNDLYALSRLNGLTVGPNGDINIQTLGSPTALIAGINANKVNAIANTPPTTVQPSTIEIEMYKIAPVSMTPGHYLTTTTSIIQSHADTVSALVTALTEAQQYRVKHPASAQQIARSLLATPTFGITSPEEQDYLISFEFSVMTSTVPSRASYAAEIKVLNLAQSPPVTMPFSTFVLSKYAKAAAKSVHIK